MKSVFIILSFTVFISACKGRESRAQYGFDSDSNVCDGILKEGSGICPHTLYYSISFTLGEHLTAYYTITIRTNTMDVTKCFRHIQWVRDKSPSLTDYHALSIPTNASELSYGEFTDIVHHGKERHQINIGADDFRKMQSQFATILSSRFPVRYNGFPRCIKFSCDTSQIRNVPDTDNLWQFGGMGFSHFDIQIAVVGGGVVSGRQYSDAIPVGLDELTHSITGLYACVTNNLVMQLLSYTAVVRKEDNGIRKKMRRDIFDPLRETKEINGSNVFVQERRYREIMAKVERLNNSTGGSEVMLSVTNSN